MWAMITIGGRTVDAGNPCALNAAIDREIRRLDDLRSERETPLSLLPSASVVFVTGADGGVYPMALDERVALSLDGASHGQERVAA